jgi:hypothetical protein
LEPNQYNAYSVNRITAKKVADGSVIQFGGATAKADLLAMPVEAG